MQVKGAEIAFSPGFRWGTTLLPGQAITLDHVMDWTAITYPQTTVNELTGEMIKTILEDVCDNLFNPDPYYQQGGDMVRVGGLTYTCTPGEAMGKRISDMRLDGKPIAADRKYKVAGWAPVAEGREGRADLGRGHAVPARPQDHRPGEAQPAEAGRDGRQPRDRLMAAPGRLLAGGDSRDGRGDCAARRATRPSRPASPPSRSRSAPGTSRATPAWPARPMRPSTRTRASSSPTRAWW